MKAFSRFLLLLLCIPAGEAHLSDVDPAATNIVPITPSPVTGTVALAGAAEAATTAVRAFYVAVNGNDATGNGTAAHPFATLARALRATEGSSIRTVYVGGGTYNLKSGLYLTSADNGVAFIAAPGQKPVLTGGAAHLTHLITLNRADGVTLAGLTFENAGAAFADGAVALHNSTGGYIVGNRFNNNGTGVLLNASNNNVISGNEIENSVTWGVSVINGSNYNTIDSNKLSGTTLQGTGTASAAISLVNGGAGNAITHNAIKNTAGTAILIVDWMPGSAADYNVGDTVAYNSIINANSATSGWSAAENGSQDAGAIDLGSTPGTDMNILIDHNYIDTLTNPSTGLDVGIYLDQWASGVTVSNNIVVGGNMNFLIHGGANNTLTNNIFDVGPNTAPNLGAGLLQSCPTAFDLNAPVSMTNNMVSGNIIYSRANGVSNAYVVYEGTANVSNNLYYNANGQPINTAGVDSRPISGNPQFANPSAGDFRLGSGSAAGTVGFRSIDQSGIGLAPKTVTWW